MDLDLEPVTRQAVADTTGGRVMAQVNKAKHEVAEVGEDHHHVVELQMNYEV